MSTELGQTSFKTSFPDVPMAWEPLTWRGRERCLSAAESKKVMKPSHREFLLIVEELMVDSNPESWLAGLQYLELIPRTDMYRINGVIGLKAQLLRRLGRNKEADFLQMEHLLHFEQEELWLEDGIVFSSRLEPSGELDADERKLWMDRLYELCQRSSLVVPNLIWAAHNTPTEEADIEMQSAIYRRGLAWERWRLFPAKIPKWLNLIARAWLGITPWLWQYRHFSAVQFFVNVFPRFPWHLWPDTLPDTFIEWVGKFFSRLERWDILQPWLESMQNSSPHQALIWTWLGLVAEKQGQSQRTTKCYREALRLPKSSESLELKHIMSMVRHFYEAKLWPDMETALQSIEHDDRIEVLHFRFFCQFMQNRHEIALLEMERICKKAPDDPKIWGYRWFLLEILQREESLGQELLGVLEQEPDSKKGRMARIFMGLHDIRHYRFEAGSQRLDGVTQADVTGENWDGNGLWARVLEAQGQCARFLGDNQAALPWFFQALSAEASEWRCHQVLSSLIAMENIEQAEALLSKALDMYPNSRCLAYDRYILVAYRHNWEEAWECLEFLTLDFFRETQIFKEGLFIFLQVLVYLNRWWDAFLLCEEHLSSILEDPELSAIRKQLIQDIGQRYHDMQEELGQRNQQLARLERQHQSLFVTLEHTRRKHDALRQSFSQQEHLHQQWKQTQQQPSSPQQPDSSKLWQKLAIWQQTRADLFSALTPDKQNILQSAEYLWLQLAEHPQHDHGPVILQLSRVVEGLVNQRLIDPLVRIALAQGGALHQFPSVSVGSLRPEHNRLSLGDAAHLLFGRREYTDADGSVVVEVNPQSVPAHRDWLQRLWPDIGLDVSSSEVQAWIDALPTQLRELARIRNRASHAGTPLPRDTAAQVRALVLGEGAGRGLLSGLVRLRIPGGSMV